MKRVPVALCAIYAIFFACNAAIGQAQEWQAEPGFRWANLDVPLKGATGFTLLTPGETGVTFNNVLEEMEGAANRVLYNGSGVAVGDYDNDGLPDIYFCGLQSRNVLYKNLGNWKFKDVTEETASPVPESTSEGLFLPM